MAMFGIMFMAMFGLVGGDKVPEDFLSLVSSKEILVSMKQDVSEDSLIRNISLGQVVKVETNLKAVNEAVEMLRTGNGKQRRAARKVLKDNVANIEDLLKKLSNDDDPEVSELAEELLKQVADKKAEVKKVANQEGAVKILSVRTLANMKSQKAIPALQALTKNADLSLAYEARRALAVIKGSNIKRLVASEAIADSLKLLPEQATIVAAYDLTPKDKTVDILGLFEEIAKLNPQVGPMKDMMLEEIMKGFPQAVNAVGSVRIDTITLGVSETAGNSSEWPAALIFKGWYDVDRVAASLTQNGRNQEFEVDGAEGKLIEDRNDAAFWLKDENTFIIIFQARGDVQSLARNYISSIKSKNTAAKKWAALPKMLTEKKSRLVALGNLSESQTALYKKEMTKELERMKGRNQDPDNIAGVSFMTLILNAMENEGMSAFAGVSEVKLELQIKDEKRAKLVLDQVEDFSQKLVDMMAYMQERMQGRGNGNGVVADEDEEVADAKEEEKKAKMFTAKKTAAGVEIIINRKRFLEIMGKSFMM